MEHAKVILALEAGELYCGIKIKKKRLKALAKKQQTISWN
jgi:hypothetical protein